MHAAKRFALASLLAVGLTVGLAAPVAAASTTCFSKETRFYNVSLVDNGNGTLTISLTLTRSGNTYTLTYPGSGCP
jgi:cell division ATPase FtsA